eukprot:GHVH01004213.1.p2 GENE.GHVH01004213.1~~GHVH01004213.1.p2  ORF type:complete len:177 (+),score=34.85 GHVH01004213.1:198-728(+)
MVSEYETYDPSLTILDVFIAKEKKQNDEIREIREAMVIECTQNLDAFNNRSESDPRKRNSRVDVNRAVGILMKKSNLRVEEVDDVQQRFIAGALARNNNLDVLDMTVGKVVTILKNECRQVAYALESGSPLALRIPLERGAYDDENVRLTGLSQLEHPPFTLGGSQAHDENTNPNS